MNKVICGRLGESQRFQTAFASNLGNISTTPPDWIRCWEGGVYPKEYKEGIDDAVNVMEREDMNYSVVLGDLPVLDEGVNLRLDSFVG
jgi:hypothetical protein